MKRFWNTHVHGGFDSAALAVLAVLALGSGCSGSAADNVADELAADAGTARDAHAPDGDLDGTDGGGTTASHVGLISVQEASTDGRSQLAIQVQFTPITAPAYEELPGQLTGCKVWIHDASRVPPASDQGLVRIRGIHADAIECRFDGDRGYGCELDQVSQSCDADLLHGNHRVSVEIEPGGAREFDFAPVGPITPGEAFRLDDASRQVLASLRLDGSALRLSCAGAGGDCGPAPATIIRLQTTDGSIAGVPSTTMPAARQVQTELQCVNLGAEGTVLVPVEAMAAIARAHSGSAMTRARLAFMREGVGLAVNRPGLRPNVTRVLVGHAQLLYKDL